ncbi:hypothetical protein AOLI_G00176260 [Acnodon oligacanthus]
MRLTEEREAFASPRVFELNRFLIDPPHSAETCINQPFTVPLSAEPGEKGDSWYSGRRCQKACKDFFSESLGRAEGIVIGIDKPDGCRSEKKGWVYYRSKEEESKEKSLEEMGFMSPTQSPFLKREQSGGEFTL